MMHLRIALTTVIGQILRILLYARYSTEEQHRSSIDDQFAYCEAFLRTNLSPDAKIDRISDPETSGELVSRPGIDEVRAGILTRRWDIIIVEDSSRLYRHETACGELIEAAVDKGIRVICINDNVDTAEEYWEDPLHHAARHHASSNVFTAKRIKRKLEGLWQTGAAIGLLCAGYKRRATRPASAQGPAEGPFFDEIDDTQAPLVAEVYERIARGNPPWAVADWLTAQGLPKASNSRREQWTDRNVVSMIQRTVYRGTEEYARTRIKKEYKTGRHRQVRNAQDQVLQRDVPHLRVVSDELWHAANKAIKGRATKTESAKGLDHPLAGIPRDSRGPLSGILVCGICGFKMYREGRNEGGYRCGNARHGMCWNKATAVASLVHEQISTAVVDELLGLNRLSDMVVERVREICADHEPLHRQLAEKQAEEAELSQGCARLLDAIEKDSESTDLLLLRLQQRREQLAVVSAKIEALRQQLAVPATLPTRSQIEAKIAQVKTQILVMDRETGVLLRHLVTQIRAVPYQQFGSNLVVLRAHFDLKLMELLPDELLRVLRGTFDEVLADRLRTIPLRADLFKPSSGPRHFAQALALSEAKLTLVAIGEKLGTAKRQAHIAVQYGKQMREAGLIDPYVELTEPPAVASRWGPSRLQLATASDDTGLVPPQDDAADELEPPADLSA